MSHETVRHFLRRFSAWAAAQPDILAVGLVGSHARNTARKDSDVDLVILVREPSAYLQHTQWTQRFGEVRREEIEDYGELISVRVWYSDDREVEYGITDERWAALPLDAGSQQVIADGLQVLFERTPILSRHLPKQE